MVFFCLSSQAGLKVSPALPEKVKIVEVGPRDGLQNEKVNKRSSLTHTTHRTNRTSQRLDSIEISQHSLAFITLASLTGA